MEARLEEGDIGADGGEAMGGDGVEFVVRFGAELGHVLGLDAREDVFDGVEPRGVRRKVGKGDAVGVLGGGFVGLFGGVVRPEVWAYPGNVDHKSRV